MPPGEQPEEFPDQAGRLAFGESLLDSTRSAPLRVNGDGRLDGYTGLGSIGVLEGRVFELRR